MVSPLGDGDATAVEDPVERVWQAAMAVKEEITRDYDFGPYILAVAVFPDMEPDEALMAVRGRRAVKMLWGMHDLVERVIGQLDESKRRPALSAEFVEKDIRALTRGRSARRCRIPGGGRGGPLIGRASSAQSQERGHQRGQRRTSDHQHRRFRGGWRRAAVAHDDGAVGVGEGVLF